MDGFPRFSLLPPELRLSIWEAADASPSMHVFDLCMPEPDVGQPGGRTTEHTEKRAEVAFRRPSKTKDSNDTRYNIFKDTVFFDALPDGHDPSMYRWKMALTSACVEARMAASPRLPAASSANSVYLPGPDRHIQYDNGTDVLHLRFGPTLSCPKLTQPAAGVEAVHPAEPAAGTAAGPAEGCIETGLLDRQWSAELAETIRTARQIALDAGQTNALVNVHNNPILEDEIHMLASTMSCTLKALYLVDYCSSGMCMCCGQAAVQRGHQNKKGALYNGLNIFAATTTALSSDTPATRLHGVGVMYEEVFGLEGLGWTDRHPAYIFGKALGKAIREQQADAGRVVFKGVKVLVAEKER